MLNSSVFESFECLWSHRLWESLLSAPRLTLECKDPLVCLCGSSCFCQSHTWSLSQSLVDSLESLWESNGFTSFNVHFANASTRAVNCLSCTVLQAVTSDFCNLPLLYQLGWQRLICKTIQVAPSKKSHEVCRNSWVDAIPPTRKVHCPLWMFSVSLLSRLFVAVSHLLCKISVVNVWVSFEISRERCWHSRWEFLHKQGKLLIGPTWISFYQMCHSHVGLAVWPEDLGKDLVRSYSGILDRWSMVCLYLLKCHGLVKPSEYQQDHIRMKRLTFLSASFHYVSVHFSWKLNSVDFAELVSNLYKIETSA
jgi:hypothetical protein